MSLRPFRPILALVLLLVTTAVLFAADVPYLRGRVTDDAEILATQTVARITEQLRAHENATTEQVAVLTIPSLEGEGIESFAQRVFETWKLGRKAQDNGVLVVIAPQDRRMRIEVGYGLEGKLTDLEAGRIIRNIMAPRFKSGDFDGGVEAGVLAVLGQLQGQGGLPPDPGPQAHGGGFNLETPDMPIYQRILFGVFTFGIIGLFTVLGVLTPGVGWFLYFFLIPFWAMFPMVVAGPQITLGILVTYLVLFPLAKIIVSRQPWYHKARKEIRTKGGARIGGMWIGGGAGSLGDGGFSSGGGFSGGGGSSGGGGASGGW
jgi:uncharacterized protein